MSSASAASSVNSASTIGGRPAHKRGGKTKAEKGRIRQGSAGEEAALVKHVMGLGPQAHALAEAGQLGELLCLLGHWEDAAKLQQRVSGWQAAAAEAAADVAAHPQGAGGGGSGGGAQRSTPPAAAAPEALWKWEVLRAGQ